MLNKRVSDFHELVWRTASRVGMKAAKITDEILSVAFPSTARAARDEGADAMLRAGVYAEVNRIIRKTPGGDDAQHDFASIDPAFHDLVKPLRSRTYLVEAIGEHVPVPMLIAEPALLDDARRHMRRKGEETIAEADRLDALYRAVTDSSTPSDAALAPAAE